MVQGVGFRPYVHRLATALGLGGSVLNDGAGVVVEVEGAVSRVQTFIDRLPAETPPLALVESVIVAEIPPVGATAFTILTSREGDVAAPASIAPDTATCPACLAELFDPADRRFRYPFINCTDCGPRFTIVRGVPYDRPLTTMAGFAMCAACLAEYQSPQDRRFHAQPNACPACGPSVRLVDATGEIRSPVAARDSVAAAAATLLSGAIVAVKGIGGYHLACRADDEEAVRRLRDRKRREAKPFALMVRDLGAARRLVHLDAVEEALLTGRERPIVLARRRGDGDVAYSVAPGGRDLGVMLPYSPLHHLLLADTGVPLVMTSGNRSGEPIAYRDDESMERLAGVADLFLVHDRPIEVPADDSVARVVTIGGERRPVLIRRSRGYVPAAIDLPVPAERPVLGCGGQLKNAFCLAMGRRAWPGPHIGDLEDYDSFRAFEAGIGHFERLFGIVPEIVAHDLHPDYAATRYALGRVGPVPDAVQHHHAHLAACLAEHGETGPAVGAIFDGTGYGTDGSIWGGEILVGDLGSARRVGHLWPVRMPGGEAAIREPWRMAVAWLSESTPGPTSQPPAPQGRIDPREWRAVAHLLRTGHASPLTTSVGRLIDAVAALCGVRARVTYEGQAAIELEALADPGETVGYSLPVLDRSGVFVLDGRALVRAALADLEAGTPVGTIAARFLDGLAEGTAWACFRAAEREATGVVVLSGGVFQNVRLLEGTAVRLEAKGLRVLIPERVPPNDGGLAFGQVAVSAWRQRNR